MSETTSCQDRKWARLVAATRGEDETAYREFLQEVRTWLCRYYSRRLPAAVVEDATQEALIAVHEKRHTYNPDRPFGPWLGAIARYKWIDRLRAAKASEAIMANDLIVPDHAPAVTSAVVLSHLLKALKREQSDVIRLVKVQGLSIEEASRSTGQSSSLVKVNIHRGIARLIAMVRQATSPIDSGGTGGYSRR